jgi:hypothetical protein
MKTSSKRYPAASRLRALFLLTLAILLFFPVPRAQCQTEKCPGERLIEGIGDKVPAFGGLFLDESRDTLYAYMVPGEAGDRSTLDQAISDVLGPGRPAVHQLQVLPGRYTYQQLSDWNDLLSGQVFALATNVYIYVDDPNNRLKVGLGDLSLAPSVEAALPTLGIPADAVVIEQGTSDMLGTFRSAQEPAADSDPLATLRDRFRPIVGGLQVQIDQEDTRSVTICTQGFNATRGKDRGFVTANHCIHDRTSPKTAVFFQPSVAKDNRVGLGEISPPPFDMKKNKKCLEGDKCRYSDTMFVKLDDGVQSSQGLIARPAAGSSDWNGTDTFSIVGKATPMYGLNVTYVGSQTGRIDGQVTVASFSLRSDDGIRYLCQTVVKWKTVPVQGDSGSPAFSIGSNNEVDILGIVWGTKGVSPMVNIEVTDELGPLLQVCVAGKKC